MIHYLLLLSSLLFAAPGPDKLTQFFSLEQTPGRGKLQFGSDPKKLETIELGKKSGLYSLGMIFPGKSLPGSFGADFKDRHVIQVAMGKITPPKDGTLPQFASVTFISQHIPTTKTVFTLSLPNSEALKKQNAALLLFTTPTLKLADAEEEKLKKTYFANGGTVTLTPVGFPVVGTLKEEGKNFQFYHQLMRADYQVDLSTPFVKESLKLTGATEGIFYWPKDAVATARMGQIALESLQAVGVVPPGK